MKYIDYRLWKEGKLRRKIHYTDGSSRMGTFFIHEYIALLEMGVRKIYVDRKNNTWCSMGLFNKRQKLWILLLGIRNASMGSIVKLGASYKDLNNALPILHKEHNQVCEAVILENKN